MELRNVRALVEAGCRTRVSGVAKELSATQSAARKAAKQLEDESACCALSQSDGTAVLHG
jgi:DNA-binding transcriptional LysR family regulator